MAGPYAKSLHDSEQNPIETSKLHDPLEGSWHEPKSTDRHPDFSLPSAEEEEMAALCEDRMEAWKCSPSNYGGHYTTRKDMEIESIEKLVAEIRELRMEYEKEAIRQSWIKGYDAEGFTVYREGWKGGSEEGRDEEGGNRLTVEAKNPDEVMKEAGERSRENPRFACGCRDDGRGRDVGVP